MCFGMITGMLASVVAFSFLVFHYKTKTDSLEAGKQVTEQQFGELNSLLQTSERRSDEYKSQLGALEKRCNGLDQENKDLFKAKSKLQKDLTNLKKEPRYEKEFKSQKEKYDQLIRDGKVFGSFFDNPAKADPVATAVKRFHAHRANDPLFEKHNPWAKRVFSVLGKSSSKLAERRKKERQPSSPGPFGSHLHVRVSGLDEFNSADVLINIPDRPKENTDELRQPIELVASPPFRFKSNAFFWKAVRLYQCDYENSDGHLVCRLKWSPLPKDSRIRANMNQINADAKQLQITAFFSGQKGGASDANPGESVPLVPVNQSAMKLKPEEKAAP